MAYSDCVDKFGIFPPEERLIDSLYVFSHTFELIYGEALLLNRGRLAFGFIDSFEDEVICTINSDGHLIVQDSLSRGWFKFENAVDFMEYLECIMIKRERT